MTSSSWPIDTPSRRASLRHRRHRADRDTTQASMDLAQIPKLGPRRLILPVRIFRRSPLRRRPGSCHYRTRSLAPWTYSTTALLISGHRHKLSPSTLIRAQQTFGCPQSVATAMVINSTRVIVQLFARPIRISLLPMWVIFVDLCFLPNLIFSLSPRFG